MARTAPPPVPTDAVILGLHDYGDANRIVTLLTRERGKVSAFARAARRSQRRFGGGLILFARGGALLAERPGAELMRLEGFSPRDLHAELLGNLDRIAVGSYLAELVRELLREDHAEPEVFSLLCAALGALGAPEAPPPGLIPGFELALLDRLGLGAPLERCAVCGRTPGPERGGARLDLRAGGLVCGRGGCGLGRPVPEEVRATLVALAASTPLAPAAVDPELARRAGRATRALVLHHLGRPPRSLALLEQLASSGPR